MRGMAAGAGQASSDLRRALSEIIREETADNGLVVQRVTRTAARRAEGLLQMIYEGLADGIGEQVTAPDAVGGTHFWFMYDESGYDGDDGYGA